MPRGSNQRKKWTPEMIGRLRELVGARELSGGEIAEVVVKEFRTTIMMLGLSVTRNAVAGQVHKLHLKLQAPQNGRKMIRPKPTPWSPSRRLAHNRRMEQIEAIAAMPEPEAMPEPPWVPPPPPPAPPALPPPEPDLVEPEIDSSPDEKAFTPIEEFVPKPELVSIYSVARADLRGHNNNPIRPPAMAGAFAKKDLAREKPTSDTVDLFGLSQEKCRWPIQDRPAYLFCGAQTVDGLPYCASHVRRALGVREPRRGREFILPR
jgi:hypothetical protein